MVVSFSKKNVPVSSLVTSQDLNPMTILNEEVVFNWFSDNNAIESNKAERLFLSLYTLRLKDNFLFLLLLYWRNKLC